MENNWILYTRLSCKRKLDTFVENAIDKTMILYELNSEYGEQTITYAYEGKNLSLHRV